jgi:hypothetical protein
MATGAMGIRFNDQGDERRFIVRPVSRALGRGILLPRLYLYPNLSHEIVMACAIPEALARLAGRSRSIEGVDASSLDMRRYLSRWTDSRPFFIRTRLVFLFLTHLSILWAYLWLRLGGRGRGEALLACALMAFSFEISYHARWISPNGLVMMSACACMTAIAAAERWEKRRIEFLALAAAAAGLAAGSKYPAWLLMLPVMAAAWKRVPRGWFWSLPLVFFAGAFLITTPGIVLDPFRFAESAGREFNHYVLKGHIGNTVGRGPEHFLRACVYLFAQTLSHRAAAALLLSLLAVAGVWRMWRDNRRQASLFLIFPVVYLLAFAGVARVLFVRNYLVLIPFLAVAAARGGAWLYGKTAGWKRWACAAAISAILAMNAAYVAQAAHSLRDVRPERHVRELAAYMVRHPQWTFRITRLLKEDLVRYAVLPANATTDPGVPADAAAAWSRELWQWPRQGRVLSNRMNYTLAVFGPLDRNFDYYPLFGNARIPVLRAAEAKRIGLFRKLIVRDNPHGPR